MHIFRQAAIKPCQLDKNVTQQTAQAHTTQDAVFIGQTTLDAFVQFTSARNECASTVTVAQVTPSVTPARRTRSYRWLPCNPAKQPYRSLSMRRHPPTKRLHIDLNFMRIDKKPQQGTYTRAKDSRKRGREGKERVKTGLTMRIVQFVFLFLLSLASHSAGALRACHLTLPSDPKTLATYGPLKYEQCGIYLRTHTLTHTYWVILFMSIRIKIQLVSRPDAMRCEALSCDVEQLPESACQSC